jgi:hypothetical protein
MRRRGLASVEEGLPAHEVSQRLQERKRLAEEKKQTTLLRKTLCAVVCIAICAQVSYLVAVAATRVQAARSGATCSSPASTWLRADVALVAFANQSIPALIFPSYVATSGDYVRSYENSPLCPKQTSRMRHKHITVSTPFGRRINLTEALASCVQHYADYFTTRQCD